MKKINNQSGFISILLAIIILVGIGIGVYFYSGQKNEVEVEDVQVATDLQSTTTPATTTDVKVVAKTILPDSAFLKDFIKYDSNAKIVARGDINSDGYEDAIVQVVSCGASCSIDLVAVLNLGNNKTEGIMNSDFGPAYVGSSAAKSNVTNVEIKNGIISLIGTGLECTNGVTSESNLCTQDKWSVVKTVKYKYDGRSIVQLSVFPIQKSAALLKECPTFKVINQMPTTIPNNNPPSTYFILNGERREMAEFDLSWISKNCSIETQTVY